MPTPACCRLFLPAFFLALGAEVLEAQEDWLQFKYDSRHSGNVPDRSVKTPLGLVGSVPLTDSVFTAPVVSNGRVYVVDGAGVAFCIDATTLKVVWKFESRGGKANCNNICSPALAGRYLHFGTMAGFYYVLDAADGKVVKVIACGEPILSTPVVGRDRVYFATLGSRVHSIEPDGTLRWVWDFVKEILNFHGNRWSGESWVKHKKARVKWSELFTCSANLALYESTLVVPAGGLVIWLKDLGDRAEFLAANAEKSPGVYLSTRATFGLSLGERGEVYRQSHRLDNGGEVSIFSLGGGKVVKGTVPGTKTGAGGGLLSFCSVSVRGEDVYRCRPEENFGLCRHAPGQGRPESLGGYPSIASPILLRDKAVYGGLDGRLHVVPLSGDGASWSFGTAFGKPISSPAAVCDGRIIFGCEDGYLYVLGPEGKASPPSRDLELWKVRSPLAGSYTDPKYDRYTAFGDWGSTNANRQGLRPPFKIKWIRPFKGTVKHFSTCGGGRVYTHTAEGQVFAVEQETGRLLWRRYWPGVFISYTAASYHRERLLVPQAGVGKSRLRCLDAATGRLLWEAPFSGSPNWNRQLAPIVHDNLVFYQFSTGRFGRRAAAGAMKWLNSYGVPRYPDTHKPLVRAWDFRTGKEVWTRDFSGLGSGGDEAGLVLMDGTLYYSCFFGNQARRRGEPGPRGVTAALKPETGESIWSTTRHHLRGGCTLSAKDGRLYLGGTDRDPETRECHVWCLDAKNGSLIWRSDPIRRSIKVVSVGDRHCFTHAQKKRSYLIDRETGKIVSDPTGYYKCTPFTLSEPYLLASHMDLYDLSKGSRLVSSGPAMDTNECVSAMVSNGRIFYTAHGFGMQVSQVYGAEAASWVAPWEGK